MSYRFQSDRQRLPIVKFLGLLGFSIICLWASSRVAFVKKELTMVAMPLQSVLRLPAGIWQGVSSHFTSNGTLLAENSALKKSLLSANVKAAQAAGLAEQNATLKKLLGFTKQSKLSMAPVSVLSQIATPYLQKIIATQTAAANVKVGDVVLLPEGVVGQVMSTSSHAVTILPIVAKESAVPVTDKTASFNAIAQGNGEMGLSLLHVVKQTPIKVGDVIVTSGLGGRFPAGYPIAVVSSVSHAVSGDFLQIALKPLAKVSVAPYLMIASLGGANENH